MRQLVGRSPDAATRRATTETYGRTDRRLQALQWLQSIPNLAEQVGAAAASDSFKVVISERNARLFKKGIDGYWKPYLLDAGKFVENVNLERIAPDKIAALSNILLSINMASVAASLDEIRASVHDLSILQSNLVRGETYGSVSALRQASVLTDPAERREGMLDTCRILGFLLVKLGAQIKSHGAAMHDAKTGLFDGFISNGLEKAEAKWEEVKRDLNVMKLGLAALINAYTDLGEPTAAGVALQDVLVSLHSADFKMIGKKARLIKLSQKAEAPEEVVTRFIESIERIDVLCRTDLVEHSSSLELEFTPGELTA